MPAAYSYDLRKKAMEALDEGQSREEVAERFKIGKTTLDIFQNSFHQLQIVNANNQVEPQTKTFSPISIAICNNFGPLEQTNHIFHHHSFACKPLIFLLLLLGQRVLFRFSMWQYSFA